MHRILLLVLHFILLVLLALMLHAEPRPAAWFTDGAVLQQGRLVPIWGSAEPGERITVSFLEERTSTTADASGAWQVLLPAMQPTAQGNDLRIQGSTTVVIRDVVIGDVWLCAGEAILLAPPDPSDLAPATPASPTTAATIRLATWTPVDGSQTRMLRWEAPSIEALPRIGAIPFGLARALQRKITVPIGVVTVAEPNAPIESWLSPAICSGSVPAFAFIAQRWQADQAAFPAQHASYLQALTNWNKAEQKAKARGANNYKFFLHKNHAPVEPLLHAPAATFNTQIQPLLPMALRGLIWVHGEANASHPDEYQQLLQAFIDSERALLGAREIPVIIVQTAGHVVLNDSTGQSIAKVRQAQALVAAQPGNQLIITLDLAPGTSEMRTEIAQRISQTILATTYSLKVEHQGPCVKAVSIDGARIKIDFDHAATGLIAYKKPVQALEVAGIDGKFYAATVKIQGSSLIISSASVPVPHAIRYAWSNAPFANLANGAGLPAAPFQLADLHSIHDRAVSQTGSSTQSPTNASAPATTTTSPVH